LLENYEEQCKNKEKSLNLTEGIKYLLASKNIKEKLNKTCEIINMENENIYKLSKEKLFSWLKSKVFFLSRKML